MRDTSNLYEGAAGWYGTLDDQKAVCRGTATQEMSRIMRCEDHDDDFHCGSQLMTWISEEDSQEGHNIVRSRSPQNKVKEMRFFFLPCQKQGGISVNWGGTVFFVLECWTHGGKRRRIQNENTILALFCGMCYQVIFTEEKADQVKWREGFLETII